MPRGNFTFRVFVSSTFTDMRAERRILQEDVFPRLKTLCESKGATFQDVDLRWGVNEESQLDQKTMDICLGEIARCQRLSPKPNFIILLGDKYGWQPVPARIPSSEIALILSRLREEEKSLITCWYREDTNAIPPEYVLQPRDEAVPALQGARSPLRLTGFSVYASPVLFTNIPVGSATGARLDTGGWLTLARRDFHPERYVELSSTR